jgi:hypothetical protein
MPTLDEFQNAQERYGKLGYRLIKRYGKRGARVKYQYATLNMVRRKNILRGVSYSLSHMTLHFYYYPIVSWGLYSSDSSMSSRQY